MKLCYVHISLNLYKHTLELISCHLNIKKVHNNSKENVLNSFTITIVNVSECLLESVKLISYVVSETMFVYEECSLDEQIVLAGFMPSSMVYDVCGGTAPLKARMYGITRF